VEEGTLYSSKISASREEVPCVSVSSFTWKVYLLLLNELQLTISESKILLVLYHRLGFTKEGAVLGIQDLVVDSHLKP
jgi:hypothetical protein